MTLIRRGDGSSEKDPLTTGRTRANGWGKRGRGLLTLSLEVFEEKAGTVCYSHGDLKMYLYFTAYKK